MSLKNTLKLSGLAVGQTVAVQHGLKDHYLGPVTPDGIYVQGSANYTITADDKTVTVTLLSSSGSTSPTLIVESWTKSKTKGAPPGIHDDLRGRWGHHVASGWSHVRRGRGQGVPGH